MGVNKLKVILIHGKARHGKDTLAEAIIRNTIQSAIVSFAQPIKDYLTRYEDWDGVTKDDYWRGRMQLIGTEIGRDMIDKDMWVKIAGYTCNLLYATGTGVVAIPDLRMENELNSIYHHLLTPKFRDHCDIVSVKIVRDALVDNSPLGEAQRNHSTEKGLDDEYFDEVIHIPEFSNKGVMTKHFNKLFSDKIAPLLIGHGGFI